MVWDFQAFLDAWGHAGPGLTHNTYLTPPTTIKRHILPAVPAGTLSLTWLLYLSFNSINHTFVTHLEHNNNSNIKDTNCICGAYYQNNLQSISYCKVIAMHTTWGPLGPTGADHHALSKACTMFWSIEFTLPSLLVHTISLLSLHTIQCKYVTSLLKHIYLLFKHLIWDSSGVRHYLLKWRSLSLVVGVR